MILGAYMLYMAGRCSSIEQGGLIQEALHSGRGADKFRKMIHAQGGDQQAADDPSLLPLSDNVIPIKAEQAGYIYSIDTVWARPLIFWAPAEAQRRINRSQCRYCVEQTYGRNGRKGETLAYFYVTREDLFEERRMLLNVQLS